MPDNSNSDIKTVVRDIADLKAENRQQGATLNELKSGLSIVQSDLSDHKVTVQVQAAALDRLSTGVEALGKEFGEMRKDQAKTSRYYKVLAGLLSSGGAIFLTWLADKLSVVVDPAVLEQLKTMASPAG